MKRTATGVSIRAGDKATAGVWRRWALAVVMAIAAIVASPAAQHLTGNPLAFSLAPTLVALVAIAVAWPPRRWLGLRWLSLKSAGLSLLAPLLVMGTCAAMAAGIDGLAPQMPPLAQLLQMAAMSFAITFVLALVTEDGFFRGALWGLCRKVGGERSALIFTSVAFALWHAAATRLPGFELPLSIAPIYLINMALAGLVFGLLRWISGSLLAPALAHAVWNTIAYGFFGQGTAKGLLGIERYWLFDPERGWVGCLVTGAVVVGLYAIARRKADA